MNFKSRNIGFTMVSYIIIIIIETMVILWQGVTLNMVNTMLEQYEHDRIKLENCPICYSSDVEYKLNSIEEYYIYCKRCRLSTGYYKSPNKAAGDWNNIKR